MSASEVHTTLNELHGILHEVGLDWVIEQIGESIAGGKLAERKIHVTPHGRTTGGGRPTQPPHVLRRSQNQRQVSGSEPELVVHIDRVEGRRLTGGDFQVIEEHTPEEKLDLYITAIQQVAGLIEARATVLDTLGVNGLVFASDTKPSREMQADETRLTREHATALRDLLTNLQREVLP